MLSFLSDLGADPRDLMSLIESPNPIEFPFPVVRIMVDY